MKPSVQHPWQLELDSEERSVVSHHDLVAQLAEAQMRNQGRLALSEVLGPTPLWKRLFGAKFVARGHFSMEWCNQVASLIFLDENWSEYRAIDGSAPIAASEEERLYIAHGEKRPHPIEECMSRERAFRAITESIESCARPAWLQYRVVG